MAASDPGGSPNRRRLFHLSRPIARDGGAFRSFRKTTRTRLSMAKFGVRSLSGERHDELNRIHSLERLTTNLIRPKIFARSFPEARAYETSLVKFVSEDPRIPTRAIAESTPFLIDLNFNQSSARGFVRSIFRCSPTTT